MESENLGCIDFLLVNWLLQQHCPQLGFFDVLVSSLLIPCPVHHFSESEREKVESENFRCIGFHVVNWRYNTAPYLESFWMYRFPPCKYNVHHLIFWEKGENLGCIGFLLVNPLSTLSFKEAFLFALTNTHFKNDIQLLLKRQQQDIYSSVIKTKLCCMDFPHGDLAVQFYQPKYPINNIFTAHKFQRFHWNESMVDYVPKMHWKIFIR